MKKLTDSWKESVSSGFILDTYSGIIPTRSLKHNLNQFELSFVACGISIVSVVCQILNI